MSKYISHIAMLLCSFYSFPWLGPLASSDLELTLKLWNLLDSLVRFLERDLGTSQDLYLHRTTWHRKTCTYIYASSGIWNQCSRRINNRHPRRCNEWGWVQLFFIFLKKTLIKSVIQNLIFHIYLYNDSHRTGITQWYSAELRARWSGDRIPVEARNFSLHHSVQSGSVAHQASYPMSIRDSFLGCKTAEAWSLHSLPSSAKVRNSLNYTSTT
jgi:hypothetical protein